MYRVLALAFLFAACCPSSETIIQDKTIPVPVPEINEVLTPITSPMDNPLYAEKVVEKDTVIKIQYVPKENKVYVKVKPDTVRVTYRDTVKVTKPEIIETPFLSKVGLVATGFVLAALVCLGLYLKRKFF